MHFPSIFSISFGISGIEIHGVFIFDLFSYSDLWTFWISVWILLCDDRPVADAASKLIMKPDGILVMGTSPDVIDNPEPTKNVECDSAKRIIPVRNEAMTSMCLLPKTVLPGTHQQAELIDMNTERLDHQCGTCWYPDSNDHPGVYVCGKCRCLMALCCGYHAW